MAVLVKESDELPQQVTAHHSATRVRIARTIPDVSQLDYDSVVVVVLGDASDRLVPPEVTDVSEAQFIVAVDPDQRIPARGIGFLREPTVVQVLQLSAEQEDFYLRLGSTVQLRLEHREEQLLKAVVVRGSPTLDGLEDLARAIVSDPWGVRRPKHLAAALGVSLGQLRLRCVHLAIERLDHLITFVRMLGYEYLTGEIGMKPGEALRVVGVNDRSNFRRQWERARYLA